MRLLGILCAAVSCVSAADPGAFHVDYATYLGGSLDDTASSIAVDFAGNTFVTGYTNSEDFPLTSRSFGAPSKDHGCAFVTKVSPDGGSLIWSVCLADTSGDRVAVDSTGAVFVLTHSDTTSAITKLTPSADRIVYSKTIVGNAAAIAIGTDDSLFITGSAGADFVTTGGAYQSRLSAGTCYGGLQTRPTPYPCPDAFVVRLDSDGSLGYATYLGGSGPDAGRAIAVDAQGNAWITGDTVSPNFPTTSGALQTSFHGEVDLGPLQFGDAFVAKLDGSGSRLLYSTFLGGSAADAGFGIAVDSAGSAFVTGGTQSPDFPTTAGALQPVYGGGAPMPGLSAGDAFVIKLSAIGSVVYSTFIGGPSQESATTIGVDSQGKVYVNAFPNTARDTKTLSVLSPDGASIVQSVPVPSVAFAHDNRGALYFTGQTLSSLFFPSTSAFQPRFGGGVYDASIVKIDFDGPTSPWISTIVNAAGMRSGTPSFYPVFDIAPGEIVTVFGNGFDAGTKISIDGIAARILYVRREQINAVVPFAISGQPAEITVEGHGQTIGPATMNMFEAVPALFTADASGTGQAAAINEDGSINSPEHPASRGSVIAVYMTGVGRMTPQPADGSITPLSAPYPAPVLGVGCNIGQVVYAGAAPGLVAGAIQVNVRIANNIQPGDSVPIVIYVGNFASGFPGDTTVAIR